MEPEKKQQLIPFEKFLKALNTPPKKSGSVQTNPYANNSKYIPISYVEMWLDQYFFGLWETVNFKTEVVVNEIIGSIELKVYHPYKNIWITRTGAASTPIQLQRGSGVTEVQQKIHNTLVKDYPHLKAECVKNAARSLGKLFGRDLNRKFEDTYTPLLKLAESEPRTTGQETMIEGLLETAEIEPSTYKDIFDSIPNLSFNEASKIIEFLQVNQKNPISSGDNYTQTDIQKKLDSHV